MFTILKIVLLMVSVELSFCQFAEDCQGRSFEASDCPVQVVRNGERRCVLLVTAGAGKAFTRDSGELYCQNNYGRSAHLADIIGRTEFREMRCYIIEVGSTLADRDPKVLLGMRYQAPQKKMYTYDGTLVRKPYWGDRPMKPLTLGEHMILRADVTLERSRLTNYGYEETRYDRILCSYPVKK